MQAFGETIPSVLSSWLDPLAANALRVAALIAIAALSALALRRAPAATRHVVWTLALVGCSAMPLASALLPGWSPPGLARWSASNDVARIDPPVAEFASPPGTQEQAPVDQAGADRLASSAPSEPRVPPAVPMIDRLLPLALPALSVVWLVVMGLILARHGVARRRSALIARRAAPVTVPEWTRALARHGESLNLGPRPELKVSGEVPVPVVCGIRRPVIVLPLHALEWSDERREAVLLHELEHIRRRDLLTVRLAQLACAVYWFHPLVWHAARAQRAEAERACDDRVLDMGRRASAYASDLLEIAEAARDERFASAVFAMARRSQLEQRLLAILDPAQARGAAGRAAIALSVLVALGSIGVIAAARPGKTAPEPAASTSVTRVNATSSHPAAPSRTEPPAATRVDVRAPLAMQAESQAITTPVDQNVPSPVTEAAPTEQTAAADPALAALDDASTTESSGDRFEGTSGIIDTGDGKGERTVWNWSSREGSGTYKAFGTIRFNEELTDVTGISPGGSLTIEDRTGGHLYKLSFRPRGGVIERSFTVDGDRRPWDGEARTWFAEYIVRADLASGMFVKQRFPRLMREGGPDRVLEEVARMTSDYGQAVYFHELLGTRLDEPTLERLVTQAGNDISSDYELARTLIAAAEKRALENARTRAAYLQALRSIDSDYEHARVLIVLVSRRDLSDAVAEGALSSTLRINSDYERARVLLHLVQGGHVRPSLQRSFIQKVQAMNSDYEQARVLLGLLEHGGLVANNVGALLAACETIQSDYECARVLIGLAESTRLDENGRAAYVAASEKIGSSYERNRALAAIGRSSGE